MPPKRKNSLGRKTPAAQKSAESRKRQSPEKREHTLKLMRQTSAASLENETEEERDQRLEYQRNRSSSSRAAETSPEREQRMENDRNRASTSRAMETSPERDLRLENLRIRTSISRETEDLQEREARRRQDRTRVAERRENETPEVQETQREQDRTRVAERRANETPEERRARNRRRQQLRQNLRRRGPRSQYTALNSEEIFSGEQQEEYLDIGTFHRGRNSNEPPDYMCFFCHAIKWKDEPNQMCCNKNAIQLTPIFEQIPDTFKDLWLRTDSQSKTFRKYIRPINNALAMACMKADNVAPPGPSDYNPSMRLRGKVFVGMGPLHPENEEKRAFSQMYVIDPEGDGEKEVRIRERNVSAHLPESITTTEKQEIKIILRRLQEELKKSNSYVLDLLQAHEILGDNPYNLRLCLDETKKPPQAHERTYNSPQGNAQGRLKEITVLLADKEPGDRDFVVMHRSDRKVFPIKDTHRSYDPLHFVLLFPTGTDGWHWQMKQLTGNRNLTPLQYYAYHLHERYDPPNNPIHPLLRSGRLFQEFLCVEYAKVENQRLMWIKMNQKKLRAEKYNRIAEDVADHYAQGGGDAIRSGRQVILPPSFPGSPRYMHAHFQDATAIVREFHKPDLFITFTCNPAWREITTALLPDQKAEDRPDIIARVFKQKLKAFMNEVRQNKIFGRITGFLYVVEWQKRGLPHAHILLILHHEDRIRTAADVDRAVCAELPPDPDDFPEGPKRDQARRLQKTVLEQMLHSCRVGICKENQSSPCRRFFPKKYMGETCWTQNDFYPSYRRRPPVPQLDEQLPRNRGLSAENKYGVVVDSKDVVPYNPKLLLLFDAHINVEICVSALAAKYLFKYVTKGGDRAMVGIQGDPTARHQIDINEVDDYQDLRSIGASEACWRFFQFKLTENFPYVQALRVHLEEEQVILFQEGEEERIAEDEPRTTELDQFFAYNRSHSRCQEKYIDFPKKFLWNSKEAPHEWSLRKTAYQDGMPTTIGRIHTVHPVHGGDTFYLRILLHNDHCKGKISFADLRTVGEILQENYKSVCRLLGLLADDREWGECLTEAATTKMCPQIRLLYTVILLFCEPSKPAALFEKHYKEWTDDFVRKYPDATEEQLYLLVLLDIEDRLRERSKELSDFNLPTISDTDRRGIAALTNTLGELNKSVIEQEETAFDLAETIAQKEHTEVLLTDDQRTFYTDVMAAVQSSTGKCFFLNASGGTGKTFTLNLLLAATRTLNNEKNIALAVASSGIAATLLTQGRTFHSRFKAEMDPTATSMLNIRDRSVLAQVIRDAKLIVWDEAPMMHRYHLEALDRTLQNLMGTDEPFGGKVLVLAGDFRQVLPVVERGNRSQITAAAISTSKLWRHFNIYSFTTNLRVGTSAEATEFNDWLLKLGNDELPTVDPPDTIALPDEMVFDIDDQSSKTVDASLERFIDIVFPNLKQRASKPAEPDWIQWVSERAILAPLNTTVDRINTMISQRFDGDAIEMLSADTTVDAEDSLRFPVEFLNTMMPSGLPPHKLNLKKGMILMLLRNLAPRKGLCNGTRLVLDGVTKHLLCCRIAKGDRAGEEALIPRVELTNKEGDFPIRWKRRQYPVRPSFAITANKAQGQTLNTVGVWLHEPSFTHGQLYVAASRVSHPKNLHFAINKSHIKCTRNVVYSEAII